MCAHVCNNACQYFINLKYKHYTLVSFQVGESFFHLGGPEKRPPLLTANVRDLCVKHLSVILRHHRTAAIAAKDLEAAIYMESKVRKEEFTLISLEPCF